MLSSTPACWLPVLFITGRVWIGCKKILINLASLSKFSFLISRIPLKSAPYSDTANDKLKPYDQGKGINFTSPFKFEKLDGVGLHFDLGFLVDVPGANLSVDAIYNKNSNEVGVFLSPAGQVGLGGGGSLGVGLIGIYNAPNNDVLAGWFSGGQLTVVPEVGGSISYSRADGEGTVLEMWSFTVSGGVEASVAMFRGFSQSIFGIEKVR